MEFAARCVGILRFIRAADTSIIYLNSLSNKGF